MIGVLFGIFLFIGGFITGHDMARSNLPTKEELIQANIAQYDKATGKFKIINRCKVKK